MKMSKRLLLACFLSILLMILLAGCAGNKPSPPANLPSTPEQEAPVPVVSKQPGEWRSDGKISDNEYTNHQTIGELEVYTRVAGDSVMFGLTADSEGYLALGIDPQGDLRDVDFIMCAIRDGKALVQDLCGSGKHWPHPADEEAGGKMDLTDISGSGKDLTSIFEFKRKLDTGDSWDKPLKIGENKIVWAVGNSNDFTKSHSKRGSASLILDSN